MKLTQYTEVEFNDEYIRIKQPNNIVYIKTDDFKRLNKYVEQIRSTSDTNKR